MNSQFNKDSKKLITETIALMILMVYQPVKGYFMPKG